MGEIISYELQNGRWQTAVGGASVWVPAWEAIDPPANILPYLQVHHYPNEARTTAVTSPFEMTVGQHLKSMARTAGIDFTAVGRAIHIWDVSRGLGRLPLMTEANFFANLIVSEYGAEHAQSAYVSTGTGPYGGAVDAEWLDYYGPWTTIYTAYNEEGTDEPTQAELDSQAQRNLSGRTPSPVEVRVPDNSSLVLTDALRVSDLVPGVQVPLLATLNARQISQTQKIDYMRVTETPEQGENVQVTLSPATRPDSDEEED